MTALVAFDGVSGLRRTGKEGKVAAHPTTWGRISITKPCYGLERSV